MTLIRNIKTFQIIKQWATISEHSLSTILSRAESKEILSKKDEKQGLVSFYNFNNITFYNFYKVISYIL